MDRRKALLFNALFLVSGEFFASCNQRQELKVLENEKLKLELSGDLPLIRSYIVKQSGLTLQGDSFRLTISATLLKNSTVWIGEKNRCCIRTTAPCIGGPGSPF